MHPLPIPPPPAGRRSWRAAFTEVVKSGLVAGYSSLFPSVDQERSQPSSADTIGEQVHTVTLAINAAREQYNADLETPPLTLEELQQLLHTQAGNGVSHSSRELQQRLQQLLHRAYLERYPQV